MAKIVGRNARILLDNRNISPDTSSVTLNLSAEVPEVTAFCDSHRTRLTNSIRDIELSVDGFYNTGASASDAILSPLVSGSVSVAVFFSGLSACKDGRAFDGLLTQYNQQFAVADAATTSMTLMGYDTPLYTMKSFSGSATNTCGTPTVSAVGSSTLGSIDLGASSASRKIYYSYFDISGTTPTISASLQSSGDDTTFATFANFVIAPSSLVGGISSNISASRYIRAIVALAGTSPCATFFFAAGSAI